LKLQLNFYCFRKLIPGLNLHHPSLLFAYLALLAQCGLLQLLGCIGALKLNERLLNAYWFVLLFLLCGDAVLGVVWIFRFDSLYTQLEPILKQRLRAEYGVDEEFTSTWDQLQGDHMCCGVAGPLDFNELDRIFSNRTNVRYDAEVKFTGSVPLSCCKIVKEEKEEENLTPEIEEIDQKQQAPMTTLQQRLMNKNNLSGKNSVPEKNNLTDKNKKRENRSIETRLLMETCAGVNGTSLNVNYFRPGCEQKLRKWLTDGAHILGVLGYCVIAFLKVCFLGILRYEIREMIQKIRMIQKEQLPSLLFGEESKSNERICNHTDSLPRTEIPDITPQFARHSRLVANDTGNDSDTNSHCALLLENAPSGSGEAHELQDLYVRTAQI